MIFFENKPLNNDGTLVCFTAIESDFILGKCLLLLKNDYAEITEIQANDNSFIIAEGLIKAAFNYAANKNFYIGRCYSENFKKLLETMNFNKTGNIYENDIPLILMGKCGCCGK